MKRFFEKHETLCTILLIVLYLLGNSFCLEWFGETGYVTAIVNCLSSLGLLGLVWGLKGKEKYGLTPPIHFGKCLFFLPLVVLVSVNLWGGIQINHTPTQILCYILNMLNVGFIEELIFRGFLFRMLEKENKKVAVLVSSLTFGMGHIINLFLGADLLSTLLQVCYATAVGYLFVVIFQKSKSLLPCILAHSLTNALSIFAVENQLTRYFTPIFLTLFPLGYALYLNKVIKEEPTC